MRWLELFAGGGGVAAGLKMTSQHTSVAAIENVPEIAECYRVNHPGVQVLCNDIWLAGENLYKLQGDIDAIWASPVCKDHSSARRKDIEHRQDSNTYVAILPYVEAIKPNLVIVENVPGYAYHPSCQQILHTLLRLGYTLSMKVYNMADYGVPQHRERLIIQARKGPLAAPNKRPVIAWSEALQDLMPTMVQDAIPPWQTSRWTGEEDFPCIVYGHMDYKHKDGHRVRTLITSGWDEPSLAVVSASNVLQRKIALDPVKGLCFSPRETARLQTFPDTFVFPTNRKVTQEIIGNAVPPKFVAALTRHYN